MRSRSAKHRNGLTFDRDAVLEAVEATGLGTVSPSRRGHLRRWLNAIAFEYYWAEASPVSNAQTRTGMPFDALAGSTVTPSQLRDSLELIRASARRVISGTSGRPLSEKVAELTQRLGYEPYTNEPSEPPNQFPLKTGLRSAVWLYLIRAVMAKTKSRPRGLPSGPGHRPWASQVLEARIETLRRCDHDRAAAQHDVLAAAADIKEWAAWSVTDVSRAVSRNKGDRHRSDEALNEALRSLACVYTRTFGKGPSVYRRRQEEVNLPNAWQRFARAALQIILRPKAAPTHDEILHRWRKLLK